NPFIFVSFDEPALILSSSLIDRQTNTQIPLTITSQSLDEEFVLNATFQNTQAIELGKTYRFAIQSQDIYENVAATQYFDFTYNPSNLTISLVNPPYGFSAQQNVNFVVATNRDAFCRYDVFDRDYEAMIPFSQTGGKQHSRSVTLTNVPTTYYVKCQDTLGANNNDNASVFVLGYDNTAPQIIKT